MGWLKPLTLVLGCLPISYCIWQVSRLYSGDAGILGADPAKAIVEFNGQWTLYFLLLTLSITPLRTIFGIPALVGIRRMLGLFTFFYASVHLLCYALLLLELRFGEILADLEKRPYISIGFAAYLLLIPLAVTSSNAMVRLLRKRWKRLHRLIYVISLLALVHLAWLTRSDYTEVVIYTLIVALLLLFRTLNRSWFERKLLMPFRRENPS